MDPATFVAVPQYRLPRRFPRAAPILVPWPAHAPKLLQSLLVQRVGAAAVGVAGVRLIKKQQIPEKVAEMERIMYDV